MLILAAGLGSFGAASASVPGAGSAVSAECPELGSRIDGTSGSDNLLGTDGAEVIRAAAGNDRIIAFGGDDCVLAGLATTRSRPERATTSASARTAPTA